MCKETPSQVTELDWLCHSSQLHYPNNIWDQLQLRIKPKKDAFYFPFLFMYLFSVIFIITSLWIFVYGTPTGVQELFSFKSRYKPCVWSTCIDFVNTEKVVNTIVKLIYHVFYRKSIQLNAISKVTLLVQDPMWFVNDLLMAFKVRKKKTLMIKTSKWPFFPSLGI